MRLILPFANMQEVKQSCEPELVHARLSTQLKCAELIDLGVNMVFVMQTELTVNTHKWLFYAHGPGAASVSGGALVLTAAAGGGNILAAWSPAGVKSC